MFARIQKTPVRTRALFARVQTNACPESCVVRPDFKKHMSGICFCLPRFQNTPVRFCFCQPGFQNTQPGQRSTELCPERPAVPGSALWSSVPPLRAGTFISPVGLLFRLLNKASGPRTGLSGPVSGRLRPKTECEWTRNRSQTAQAEGTGSLGLVFGRFALGLRLKPAQTWPRKPGPGTGSTIALPKVGLPTVPEFRSFSLAFISCLVIVWYSQKVF